MRILKTKIFHRWANKIKLKDDSLKKAVQEIALGQFEANLGGHLYKKRLQIGNKGNIKSDEEEALKELAKIYLSYNDGAINIGIRTKEFVEVL